MKNVRLTKHMKYDIAQTMHKIYCDKHFTWWDEFMPVIKQYNNSILTEMFHWSRHDINRFIISKDWFRRYVRSQRFH